jgi:DNA-binding transcriptional LysR family regulator
MDARTLDLQALRIFKAVADEASVTRAARSLHYVQSNVTTRLKQLEAELGVRLFHRSAGRLTITQAGRVLDGYAERLLRLAQEARHAVAADGSPKGPLAIGSMETTAAARLPQVLARFHREHPLVQLSLETGPTDHLVQRVLAFELDAALVGGPVKHPELASRAVFDEELVLVTSKQQRAVRSPHDVADAMALVFRSGCTYRRRLEQWLESGGVRPKRVLEFGTFEGIVGCAAAGMGIALMPRELVQQRQLAQSVALHEVPARFAHVPTLLVWRRDADASAARDAFAACVQQLAEPRAGRGAAPRTSRAAGARRARRTQPR